MELNELPADGGEALAESRLLTTNSTSDSRNCCYFSGLTIHMSILRVQPCRTARHGEKTFYYKELHLCYYKKLYPLYDFCPGL